MQWTGYPSICESKHQGGERTEPEAKSEIVTHIVLSSDQAEDGFIQGLQYSKQLLEAHANSMASKTRETNLRAGSMLEVKYNQGYHKALEDLLLAVGTPLAEEIVNRRKS